MDERDREPLVVDELKVEWCNSYIYLGSPFTSDGCVSSAVKEHAKRKMCHALKYVSFVNKNNDIAFLVKRRVFEAALMSSLLYGCESWLNADLKPIVKLYNWCLKQLLGVRKNTCNDVCYAESGFPPLHDLVRHKQHKFFCKMWQERLEYQDDPLLYIINKVKNNNTVTGRLLINYINNDVVDLCEAKQKVINGISESNSSRRLTYKDINPSFTVHEIYKIKHNINENHRLAFTQFRVSGHSLSCETGRWNRRGRGRIPLEERLCECGSVQTERHVVQECPQTQHIRDSHQFVTLEHLFSDRFSSAMTCKIIYDMLSVYR